MTFNQFMFIVIMAVLWTFVIAYAVGYASGIHDGCKSRQTKEPSE